MENVLQMISGFPTSRIQITENISTRILDTGGAKPPLLLIHGLAASIEIWQDVIGPLARDFRVIAFDLPGFGQADKPDADYRAATFFVPMLKSLMDAVGLQNSHMIGSSMGASLIIRFGTKHQSMIHRAVLANPGGFDRYVHPFLRIPTLPVLGGIMSRPQRPVTAFGVRLAIHNKAKITKELIDEADAFSRLPGAHRAFVRTLRGVTSPFSVKELDIFETEARSFTPSTLIVWGEQDRIFPASQAERARAIMPKATIEILDHVGHYPQVDAPDRFVDLIYRHLSN
jgi:pimeloyl-ACP methyl ester carboxylesterase